MDPTTALFVRYRQHGDLDALGSVFDRLAPRLLALALHVCGNAADAEDAMQSTFVVAMQKATVFDGTQSVGPWLAGILALEAKNVARRERRRQAVPVPDSVAVAGDPVSATERSEMVATLRTHIDALPSEQRQVLLLQLQHGLAPAEIAEVLAVAPGTVRMRLHRGLLALRGMLPAGLVLGLTALLSTRGLASVRATILREAGVLAGTGMATAAAVAMGALVMKKLVVAVVLIAGSVLAFWWWPAPSASVVPLDLRSAASVERTTLAEDSRATVPSDGVGTEGVAAARAVGAAAPGSLRVSVRGVAGVRAGNTMQFPAAPGVAVVHAFVQVWTGATQVDGVDVVRHSGRTDAQGELWLPSLPAGAWRVAATVGDQRIEAPAATVVLAGVTPKVELCFVLQATLRGRVVDARGATVANAAVWAGNRRDDWHAEEHARHVATTAADGGFVADVSLGESFIGARKAGFAASWSHPVGQWGEGAVTLVLGDDPGTIVAKVEGQGGAPPARARVAVQWLEEHRRRGSDGALLGPPLSCIASEESPGRFVASGLPAGTYQVVATCPGGIEATYLSVTAGESSQMTFSFAAGLTVFGHVRNQRGQAKVGVYVALVNATDQHQTVRSDADGGFRFEGVPPGEWQLMAVSALSPKPVERSVALIDRDVEFDLVVEDGASVRGRVVDVAGRGLSGWWVTATQDAIVRPVQADRNGAFVASGLQPGTARLLVHRLPGDAERPAATLVAATDTPAVFEVVVPANELPLACMRGRVVDELGQAVTNAGVSWTAGSASGERTVQADGIFVWDALAAGHHVVQVAAPNRVAQQLVVDLAHAQRHDFGGIVLPRGAELRVKFLQPDGQPWRDRPPVPSLRSAAGQEVNGGSGEVEYRLEADEVVMSCLAPGRYTLQSPTDDELLIEPRVVDLRADVPQRLVVPTVIGSRRLIGFADTASLAPDVVMHVEVQRADGRVVLVREVRMEGGEVSLPCLLPRDELVVQARVDGVLTHRSVLQPPDHATRMFVEIARVR